MGVFSHQYYSFPASFISVRWIFEYCCDFKVGDWFSVFLAFFLCIEKGAKKEKKKIHTLLGILRLFLILNLHIWNFQITCTIHFSIILSPLFSFLGISVNYQTKFLQVSDMVPDFQEFIYRGVTLIVFESLHYHRYFLEVLLLSD